MARRKLASDFDVFLSQRQEIIFCFHAQTERYLICEIFITWVRPLHGGSVDQVGSSKGRQVAEEDSSGSTKGGTACGRLLLVLGPRRGLWRGGGDGCWSRLGSPLIHPLIGLTQYLMRVCSPNPGHRFLIFSLPMDPCVRGGL